MVSINHRKEKINAENENIGQYLMAKYKKHHVKKTWFYWCTNHKKGTSLDQKTKTNK